MNHLKFFLLSLWLVLLPAHAQKFLPPDQAFAFSAQMRGAQTVQVTFEIAPNYYMYRDEFKFVVVSPDGSVVQNGAVKLPAAQIKFDENFNKDVAIYHNRVTVDVPIKKIANSDGLFKIVVTSRGCADKGLCYPPRQTQAVLTASAAADTKVAVKPAAPIKTIPEKPTQPPVVAPQPITATPPSIQTAQATAAAFDNSAYARDIFAQRNVLYALAIVFGLGVLLSLTPCMLPMLPVLSAMLAGQRNVSRGRGFLLALAYVTGMALVYALIGVIAAQTGAGLHRYLQSPWLLGGLALLLTVLALSLFDVFQLQLPARWQTWLVAKTQGKYGYTGAAVLGAASALIASPCVTAPLVGIITYIAQSGNVALGGLALFVLAYGMGLPLLLLGAGLGQFLPKSGAWMVRIKQVIGVLMLLAALWIAQPLWGKYWQTAWGTPQAVLMFEPIQNKAQLNAAIAQSNQPVVLDLYADWCRSCIEMEQKTFSDPRVRQAMTGMTLLRVDMSNYTEAHAELLQQFNLYGPPAVMILEPITGRETIRVIGFEPAEVFVTRLSP
jgi:thiol:disulfide interchange protein DsbD